MFIHLFIYLFIYLFMHPFIHSLDHSWVRSIHSFGWNIYLFIYLFTRECMLTELHLPLHVFAKAERRLRGFIYLFISARRCTTTLFPSRAVSAFACKGRNIYLFIYLFTRECVLTELHLPLHVLEDAKRRLRGFIYFFS